MTLCKIDSFRNNIEKQKRLIALDVGKKTIGLATCDTQWKIATPHSTLWRRKFLADMQTLFKIIDDEQNIGGIVIGWPLNMNGSQGPRCDSVRDFTHAMLRFRDIPTLLHDERLSTQAAQKIMLSTNISRKKQHAKKDALAATWILQSALDQMTP